MSPPSVKDEYEVVFCEASEAVLDHANWLRFRSMPSPELAEQVVASMVAQDRQHGKYVWGFRHVRTTTESDPVSWSLPTQRTGNLEAWLDSQDLTICRSVADEDRDGRTIYRNVELESAEYGGIERRLGVKVKPPVDERGPWIHGAPAIRSDTDSCREAGKWGATGVLPPGHFWYWANAAHTSGYLAHESTGSPKR